MYNEDQQAANCRGQDLFQQAKAHTTNIFTDHSPMFPTPLIPYISPKAVLFTQEELDGGKGHLTRKSYVNGIVDHPLGAIVEFPETGIRMNMAIGHRFEIRPERFVHPKDNIQYSLGGSHSIHYNVKCLHLRDKDTGEAVSCKQRKLNCMFQLNYDLYTYLGLYRLFHEEVFIQSCRDATNSFGHLIGSIGRSIYENPDDILCFEGTGMSFLSRKRKPYNGQ